MLIARGEKYAEITGRFMKPGTLFDVGAAAGFLMKGFKNKGWEVHGIEPNSNMTGYGKKELGLDIINGTLESINNKPEVEADLILMIQVVAHLYDLDRSMKAVDRIIKKDGYLLVETWNKNSIMAGMLGQNWHEYSPPSTLNFFSKATLDMLMKNHGFLKIASGRPGKKIHSRHARSLLKHKLENSRSLKWISGIEKLLPADKYLPYPSEDLFWALYQKSHYTSPTHNLYPVLKQYPVFFLHSR